MPFNVHRATAGTVGALLVLLVLAATARATDYTVTNTSDTGTGSLRQAVLDANATTGVADVIKFNFSSGSAPFVIDVKSPDITITDPVTIDGTQVANGSGYLGTPLVRLNGAGAGNGLVVNQSSGTTTIKALSITGFGSGSGVYFQ